MPTGRLVLASVSAMCVAAAAASVAAWQTAPPAPTPPSYPGYALVWADEFDRTGEPDPKRWTYERGFVRNRELQWYQPQNARQADGLLVIEARRERVANPGYEAGGQRLAAQPRVCGVHIGEPDDARAAQLAVRTIRDARAHRHAAGIVAGVLDARRRWRLAAQRRDRHHGVLPRPAARQRRVGRREALRGDLGRFAQADRQLQGRTGRASFMSGEWTGTSARSSCRWTANG